MNKANLFRTIYKIDLNQFLANELSIDNFIDYHSIVAEMIESLVSGEQASGQAVVNVSPQLQVYCDRILGFCLKRMLVAGQDSSVEAEKYKHEIVLKYIQLCLPHSSVEMGTVLLKAFVLYLVKYILNRDDFGLKVSPPESLSRLLTPEDNGQKTFASIKDGEFFHPHLCDLNQAQLSFLNSYFVLIINQPHIKQNSCSSGDATSELDQLVQFLVDFSLMALYEIEDNSSISKILVHSLFKLADLNVNLQDLILNKCLCQLQRTFGAERNPIKNQITNEKKRLENFFEDSNLTLLTSMADHFMHKDYFARHQADSAYNYLTEAKFWHLIQTGLVHTNSLTRKRALYLLKRATDFALANQIDIKCHDDKSSGVSKGVLLYEARSKIWDDFFLCIELLEETSIHIIKPSLVRVSTIANAVTSHQLHYTWLNVLLSRAFFHESKVAIRWAVSTFFESNLPSLIIDSAQNEFYDQQELVQRLNQFILGPIMLTCQKGFLYYRADDTSFVDSCPKIAVLFSNFIRSHVNALPNLQTKIDFLETYTEKIYEQTWNSACLFFAMRTIHDLDARSLGNLSSKLFKNIMKIILSSLTTHDELLRSAILTNIVKTLIKQSEPSKLDQELLTNIVDLINVVSVKECLAYRNSTWNALLDWFNEVFSAKAENFGLIANFLDQEFQKYNNELNIDEFSLKSQSAKFAKLLLILADCQVDSKIFQKVLDSVLDRLYSCNKYVYMASEKVEKCLLILNNMITYITGSNFVDKKAKSFLMVEALYKQTAAELIDYIIRKADDTSNLALTFSKTNMYSEALKNLLMFNHESPEFIRSFRPQLSFKIVRSLIPAVLASLVDLTKTFASEWRKFVFLNVFSVVIETGYQVDVAEELSSSPSKIFYDLLLNFPIPSKTDLLKLTRNLPDNLIDDLLANYSAFSGQYLKTLWIIYDLFMNTTLKMPQAINRSDLFSLLLAKYEDSLELTSPYCLASMVGCSRHFIPLMISSQLSDEDSVHERVLSIFRKLYKLMWDIQGDVRNFFDAYDVYLNVLFREDFFHESIVDKSIELIKEVCKKLIVRGAEKSNIVKPLVDRCLQLTAKLSSEHNERLCEIFIEFLTFGDVYKKDKKNNKDVEVYVVSLGESFGTNQLLKAEYLSDPAIRMCTTYYLISAENLNSKFFDTFVAEFIAKDKKILDGNQRLFINSLVHRERVRLWQTVLTMLPRLSIQNYKSLDAYAEVVLVAEAQPSIRITIEWILVKIILLDPSYELDKVWLKFENFTTKRVGYTCSWLSIMTHLVPFIAEDKKVDFFKKILPITLSQILSANFHIRTYVEANLIKLYSMMTQPYPNVANGLNHPGFVEHAEIKPLITYIYSIIKSTIDDKERHSNIILNHFYFQFNPVEDYSLNVIYNVFPYLCGLIEDELVDTQLFLALVLNKNKYQLEPKDYEIKLPLKLDCPGSSLLKCTPGVWRFTAFKDDSLYEPTVTIEDLQKKMIPWHTLIPKQEDLESVNLTKRLNFANNDGLILVASLIDKGTNLGGISRTCEIFNVKELVIGNMRYTEDKLFQNLAVTSEKWLNIVEVAVKHLRTYLLEMKMRGYLLVGVEQTANSVQLNEFKFPSNTLLLLGNEKEGIPVELIQLLDVCVEIPQLGVIRSLNVHVSAAIAIWEYTKQQLKI